jgi:hypothetical protein
MKKEHIFSRILILAVALLSLASCSDFFESDLTNVVNTDGRQVTNRRQAFYQMCGILQLMQQIGDGYVISTELRGDNMSQTTNSTQQLRDVEFFNADTTNVYLNERKLYSLVNNCNYYIASVDSNYMGAVADTLVSQAKSIRAWAYLQLALDYGKVHYYTQPILQQNTAGVAVKDMQLSELTDTLIANLLPYCPVDGGTEMMPFTTGEYATVNSYSTRYLLLPIRYMLGELYMWKENFAEAAHMYYQLILERRLTVPSSYRNNWRNNLCDNVSYRNWDNQFSTLSSNNQVSVIPFSSDYELSGTSLPKLFSDEWQLTASPVCINAFTSQQYTINLTAVSVSGDLRGEGIYSDYGSYVMKSSATSSTQTIDQAYITKYSKLQANSSNYVCLCRAAKVYLRYAEAINRLGLHRLAMAVLKYGLNATTLGNANYVGKEAAAAYPFIDFGQTNATIASQFSSNAPLHSRGCGSADMNPSYMIDTTSGIDSLTDVENKIMDEYTLECAFEGGRFHDLMRISQYRGSTDYLAKKVAEKLASTTGSTRTYEEWVSYLSNRQHWYLPMLNR